MLASITRADCDIPVRLAGFMLRAVESAGSGDERTLDIVDRVIDLAGLFALLYAIFTSVLQRCVSAFFLFESFGTHLDRDYLLDLSPPSAPILQRILKLRRPLFISFGTSGMVFGIAATTQAYISDKTVDVFVKTKSTIFFALSVCLILQTAVLIKHERERTCLDLTIRTKL